MPAMSDDTWVQLVDERNGNVYFHNTRTGRSQWHDPSAARDSPGGVMKSAVTAKQRIAELALAKAKGVEEEVPAHFEGVDDYDEIVEVPTREELGLDINGCVEADYAGHIDAIVEHDDDVLDDYDEDTDGTVTPPPRSVMFTRLMRSSTIDKRPRSATSEPTNTPGTPSSEHNQPETRVSQINNNVDVRVPSTLLGSNQAPETATHMSQMNTSNQAATATTHMSQMNNNVDVGMPRTRLDSSVGHSSSQSATHMSPMNNNVDVGMPRALFSPSVAPTKDPMLHRRHRSTNATMIPSISSLGNNNPPTHAQRRGNFVRSASVVIPRDMRQQLLQQQQQQQRQGLQQLREQHPLTPKPNRNQTNNRTGIMKTDSPTRCRARSSSITTTPTASLSTSEQLPDQFDLSSTPLPSRTKQQRHHNHRRSHTSGGAGGAIPRPTLLGRAPQSGLRQTSSFYGGQGISASLASGSGRRHAHRRSKTGLTHGSGAWGDKDKGLENVLSNMKDRRCWGRPDRARTRSEDYVAESENGSGNGSPEAFRFRTTSSADPLVISQLSGFTSTQGWKRDRRALAGEIKAQMDNNIVPLSATTIKQMSVPDTNNANPEVTVSKTVQHSNNLNGNVSNVMNARKKRSNTTSTMFVGSTMGAPDEEAQMWCVSAVVHAHMVRHVLERDSNTSTVTPRESIRYAVFNDDVNGQVGLKKNANDDDTDNDEEEAPDMSEYVTPKGCEDDGDESEIPATRTIFTFIKTVHGNAQMENECIIFSLVYLERLIKATKGRLHLQRNNWQSIVLSALILASKVWDDLSMWNADFSMICPSFTLKRINALEVALLEAMEYNVRVSASTYAKYYFQLRAMRKKLGVGVSEDKDDARPLDIHSAKRFEFRSNQYDESLRHVAEEEANGAIGVDGEAGENDQHRRRCNTLFFGASRESMKDMLEHGYKYAGGSAHVSASIEQLVSMKPLPVKGPW